MAFEPLDLNGRELAERLKLNKMLSELYAGAGGSGGGGGGSGSTNLTTTVSPTNVIVVSDTGTDATIPLATSTNAGVMAPAQVTALANLSSNLSAKADLIGGKLDPSQVPDIALQQYLGSVASQSAMLALSGQQGDWCTRSDTGTDWRIIGDPSQISGWLQTAYPSAPVSSVAGKTGVVTLAKADVGLGNVDNTTDAAKPVSTAQQLALDNKQAKAITGTIGATAAVRRLADDGMNTRPHTVSVTPDSGCTILVEFSLDDGATYTTLATVSAPATWDYDRTPGSSWVTHVRFTRTAGAATDSTYSIRG